MHSPSTNAKEPDAPPPPWRVSVGLCLLSAALYVAAFPGKVDFFWPLAFVALVPLLFALRGASVRRALVLALCVGLPTHAIGFRWLVPLLETFSGFPTALCWLLLLGFSLLQTSRFALWFASSTWLTNRGNGVLLPFTLTFAVTEALVPVAFEWRFGAALHRVPLLQQTADVWGPTGVGVLVVLVNGVISLALRDLRAGAMARKTKRLVLLTAAIWSTALIYGGVRMRQTDARVARATPLRAGLVQGNLPLDLRDETAEKEEARVVAELAAHRSLEAAGVDFVVWSEGALPVAFRKSRLEAEIVPRLRGAGPDQTTPTVPTFVGAIVVEEDDAGGVRARNSAVLVDESQVRGRYDKRVLLPFSEYIPFGERFPFLYAMSPASGHFFSGESSAPLVTRGIPFGVVICYEDVLPGQVRETVGRGAELLVNLTNDAWFGDSAEPHAHLALAKLRSIESRRFLVRATNTGVSAIIDPVGRVTASGPSFLPTTVIGSVARLTEQTWFTRIGEAPWWGATIFLLGLALRPRKRGEPPNDENRPTAGNELREDRGPKATPGQLDHPSDSAEQDR
jgi:apolipoprotein N-acyltransferase